MAKARPASVACFFVFDPTLKPDFPNYTEEDEADAKLVYYCPSYADPAEKRSQVGHCSSSVWNCWHLHLIFRIA